MFPLLRCSVIPSIACRSIAAKSASASVLPVACTANRSCSVRRGEQPHLQARGFHSTTHALTTWQSAQQLRPITSFIRTAGTVQQARWFSATPTPSERPVDAASVAAVPTSEAVEARSNDALDADEPPPQDWWGRWTHELPFPARGTSDWYKEMALIFVVFGVTGSSSMYFVKPLVKDVLGLDGTLWDGPWSYRLVCIGVLMPCYSLLLVTFGTIAGRHHYFKRQALKMWGRLLPLHRLGIVAKPAPVARSIKPAAAAAAVQKPPA